MGMQFSWQNVCFACMKSSVRYRSSPVKKLVTKFLIQPVNPILQLRNNFFSCVTILAKQEKKGFVQQKLTDRQQLFQCCRNFCEASKKGFGQSPIELRSIVWTFLGFFTLFRDTLKGFMALSKEQSPKKPNSKF